MLNFLQSQVVQLRSERKDSHSRIDKLEVELKTMRTLLTHVLHSNSTHSSNHAHHAFHNNAAAAVAAGDYYMESPQQQQQLLRSVAAQQMQQQQQQQRQRRSSLNLSYGTINSNAVNNAHHPNISNNDPDASAAAYAAVGDELEDGEIGDAIGQSTMTTTMANGVSRQQENTNKTQMDDRIAQIVRDNVDLRSNLNTALESRKQAESKITS